MSKKHFIALADVVRDSRPKRQDHYAERQWEDMRDRLADFCQRQSPAFNRERWLGYIAGDCGKNGGKVKESN